MIDRYSRKQMRLVWSETNKFDAFLKVELLASEAHAELGIVPKEDIPKLYKATYDLKRIYEIEQETRHDIVAFTRSVSESLGDEKKWIHYGLTSTDVVDTANGFLLKQANELIESGLINFIEVLKVNALKYKSTPCIGRTHGIHADITSFGLKWALWYEEMNRNLARFRLARHDVEAGKISGAVGNFANTPPFVQDYVCEKLGITSVNISTQVLQRDRHAFYMSVIAIIGTTLEKISTEVRHLQRTEVREVEEAFRAGQKGSSAMPHKRNPIASENIAGCARVLRGYSVTSYENNPLWHERDISHSSAERIILPDATMLLDYMLARYTKVLQSLVVYPERMIENIYATNGVIFSQRVMNKLILGGLSRENAYDLIQPLSMKSWNDKLEFRELLVNSEVMNHLTINDVDNCFELEYYMRNVDTILKRASIL